MELFERHTPRTIHAVISALVLSTTDQTQREILTTHKFDIASQDGLLWFEVREALSRCNQRIAEVRQLAIDGKLRLR